MPHNSEGANDSKDQYGHHGKTATGEPSPGLRPDPAQRQGCGAPLSRSPGESQTDLACQTESSIIATDLKGIITLFNRGAERMLGYRACELIGRCASRLFQPAGENAEAASPLWGETASAPSGFEEILTQVRHSGGWTGLWTLAGKNGSPVPARLGVTVMLDGDGKPSGYLCLARDSSGAKDPEAVRHRELLNATLEAIPHPVYLKDAKDTFRNCNALFAAFLGIDKTRIIGHDPSDLESPELSCLAALAGPGTGRHMRPRTVRRSDGTSATLLCNEAPLLASDGSSHGVAGVILDITEQIRVEEEMQLQATMLEDEIAKHQRVEEVLREREKMLSLVINAVPQTIFWKDTDSVYVGCNELFARSAGLPSPADVVGKTDDDLPWRDDESEAYRRDDREVMKLDRVVCHIQETQQQADGSRIIVDTKKIPLHADSGCVVGVLGVSEDITKRMRVERELKESEERLSAIFEASQAGIVLVAPDGSISFANRRMAEMFGVGIDELLGTRYTSWLHPSDQSEVDTPTAGILAGEISAITVERHYLRRDGSDFWGYLSGRRLENSDGSLRALVGSIADVTELKSSQNALQREKERLAVTLRSIGDGVITADTRGMVVLLNRVAEELCGYRQEEATGLPLDQVFHVLDERTRLPKENSVARVLKSGEVIEQSGQGLLVSRDGKERIIASKAAPILDRDRRIPGVVLVFRDITERREIEEELFKARKLESLGILAGGIAHDFNNLLTGIMGNISLSRVSIPDNHQAAVYLDRARNGSERSKELTLQLLTFSKGGAPVKKLTSIAQILTESAIFALRGSNVRCDFDINPDLWCAEIDAGQMSQVISNLVINADQSMPEGGSIVIRAENVLSLEESDDGRRIRITVKDTGTGISEEVLNRIYDPYFSTKPTGNGLGLATVYAIIKNHDGEIQVFSRLNHGTTFAITLPAQAGSVPQTAGTEPERAAAAGRILLMDDEEAIREMAAAALSMFGYQPTVACDGEEMLELYRQAMESGAPFGAVIMDLTVPGRMGGKEAVQRLLELDPLALAIASSGYSEDPVMSHYAEYGFSGIVSKPYSLQDLDITLQEILARNSRDPEPP